MKINYEYLFIIGVTVAGLTYALTRGPRIKPLYDWNETLHVAQATPFTVKLPRGEYSVSSPDLMIQAQLKVGTETQLVMLAPALQGEVYTIKAVLVDEDSGEPFPIEVMAHPMSDFGDVPGANPRSVRGTDSHIGVARADRRSTIYGGQTS